MNEHEMYIRRCFDLAMLGQYTVAPNPMVGCVVVKNNSILAEGWHQIYGGPHAEVDAIQKVADQNLLEGASVYVNLEPCSHFGKTPPCADLLLSKKIKTLVCANTDPNPLVAGKGLQKLKEAGIETNVGILASEGRILNKRFFTYMEKKRPYIILKWAETADGFIARENFDSKWISNEVSRALVHEWRKEETAILVGKNTAIHDNPQLTARPWNGRQPIRCVIDPKLETPRSHFLWADEFPTMFFNHSVNIVERNKECIALPSIGPENIVNELYSRNISSLIVEGGAHTLNQFLDSNVWDEARVFKSTKTFGQGIKAPASQGILVERRPIVDDELSFYANKMPF